MQAYKLEIGENAARHCSVTCILALTLCAAISFICCVIGLKSFPIMMKNIFSKVFDVFEISLIIFQFLPKIPQKPIFIGSEKQMIKHRMQVPC